MKEMLVVVVMVAIGSWGCDAGDAPNGEGEVDNFSNTRGAVSNMGDEGDDVGAVGFDCNSHFDPGPSTCTYGFVGDEVDACPAAPWRFFHCLDCQEVAAVADRGSEPGKVGIAYEKRVALTVQAPDEAIGAPAGADELAGGSWNVVEPLPPGLALEADAGEVDERAPVLWIRGVPETAGQWSLTIQYTPPPAEHIMDCHAPLGRLVQISVNP